jgi:ribosome-associated protein
VNKVSSKALLRWPVAASPSLPPDVKERLLTRYSARITGAGELLITSQRYRDQGRNIDDCLEKLRELLASVATAPRKRRALKVSRAAKMRRLDAKRATSDKKRNRRGKFEE